MTDVITARIPRNVSRHIEDAIARVASLCEHRGRSDHIVVDLYDPFPSLSVDRMAAPQASVTIHRAVLRAVIVNINDGYLKQLVLVTPATKDDEAELVDWAGRHGRANA